MLFGRQNNLARRAVRPNGAETRTLRRRSVGKASLLDVHSAKPQPSLLARMARGVASLLGKR